MNFVTNILKKYMQSDSHQAPIMMESENKENGMGTSLGTNTDYKTALSDPSTTSSGFTSTPERRKTIRRSVLREFDPLTQDTSYNQSQENEPKFLEKGTLYAKDSDVLSSIDSSQPSVDSGVPEASTSGSSVKKSVKFLQELPETEEEQARLVRRLLRCNQSSDSPNSSEEYDSNNIAQNLSHDSFLSDTPKSFLPIVCEEIITLPIASEERLIDTLPIAFEETLLTDEEKSSKNQEERDISNSTKVQINHSGSESLLEEGTSEEKPEEYGSSNLTQNLSDSLSDTPKSFLTTVCEEIILPIGSKERLTDTLPIASEERLTDTLPIVSEERLTDTLPIASEEGLTDDEKSNKNQEEQETVSSVSELPPGTEEQIKETFTKEESTEEQIKETFTKEESTEEQIKETFTEEETTEKQKEPDTFNSTKDLINCSGSKSLLEEENNSKGTQTEKMDFSDEVPKLHAEISELKLLLNSMQQNKASLELEIRQKEEIIIKSQAEILKQQQMYKQEIRYLQEQISEKSQLIDKESDHEIETQLKEVRLREEKLKQDLSASQEDTAKLDDYLHKYEALLAQRCETIEDLKAQIEKVKNEHDTDKRHLGNLELAFSDLHMKFEKGKAVIVQLKANEDDYKVKEVQFEQAIRTNEERYESLKAHAKSQLEIANKEIITQKAQFEDEIAKLKAIIKRLEIKCSSVEVSLDQKIKECKQLSALCEEMTGKKF